MIQPFAARAPARVFSISSFTSDSLPDTRISSLVPR